MNRLIVTKRYKKILTCLFEQDELVTVRCEDTDKSTVGNIYIGRVKNIVKNIDAAFIEIQPNVKCYLSLKEISSPFLCNRIYDGVLKEGDDILVQVTRDRIKTKDAVVSTNISLAGRYCVISTENKKISFSSKISKKRKDFLKEKYSSLFDTRFGYIIRTNAGKLEENSFEPLQNDILSITKECDALLSIASTRTVYSCIYETLPEYLLQVRDADLSNLDSVMTDDTDIHACLKQFLTAQPMLSQYLSKLKLYQDDYSLAKLTRLETCLTEALQPKVWLPCGGYLVIEQTEALTVIDVNSGKFSEKKHMEQTFFKINLEAAKQIAQQLRVRNISGIIIIDFINMEKPENRQAIIEALRLACKKDAVKTTVVGLTQLGLMEVTRKRVHPPLREQIGEYI